MRIALVYDRVNKFGGAEQVLLALHQIWPEAPLFTAVYDSDKAPWARIFPKVIPSFLQSWPLAKAHHELYPWLTPLAFESFDFSGYDLVISVTSAEAKAVITRPGTRHICYCLTPTRYLWSHREAYLKESGLGRWLKPWQKRLRQNDLVYASRPDKMIAISRTVQARIKKYYQRHSEIIYPPVDISRFNLAVQPATADYFLIVSRLVGYKNIKTAVKAFNQLKLPLIIVGEGREAGRLKKLSDSRWVKFKGFVSDQDLDGYYQHCRALVMPQEEDFGIAAVEAQAAGRPVIALNCGGAKETVIAGKTGILYKNNTVDSLIEAVKQFNHCCWDRQTIINQAAKFSQDKFIALWKNQTSKF